MQQPLFLMDSSQAQLRHQAQSPSFAYHLNNNFRHDAAPAGQHSQMMNMAGSEMPVKTESMGTPAHGMWTTPTSSGMRPRPATIHEGFSYCIGENYNGLPAWDSSNLPLQPQQQQHTPSDTVSSRPISMHQEYYPPTTMDNGQWMQKPMEDNLEMHGIDPELTIGQAYTTDEAVPILDLRYPGQPLDGESMNFENGINPRRMSGSSFTLSTTGGLSDMTSYEDFSAALSDAPSFSSDYPPPSNRNSLMSSTQLSPVASPRMTPQGRSELVRTLSRGRASPSPRPGMRSAPYSVDAPRSNKRWSTGSYGTTQTRRQSPFVYQHTPDPYGPRMSSRHSSPTIQTQQMPLNFGNLQATQHQQYYMGHTHPAAFQRNNMLLPSQLPSQIPSQLPSQDFHHGHHYENPPPLLSHGLFRMLQSNADPHSLHGHYTDLSDPPDLYASLHEEQIPPPPEDMNPSDPDLIPHEQELRFDGDLYTPKWVRGHGNKREGWCGICKPGRWLVLKNSAFWYDKSFTHGISAATGQPFNEPQETRRMDGNPDVWEGLCGSCNDWIALVSSKKKGTTWFRHAYKCHTHPKIKDAPKRRRESSHQRLAAATTARPKVEPGQSLPQAQLHQDHSQIHSPLTPQTPSSIIVSSTPPTSAPHNLSRHQQQQPPQAEPQHQHSHQHQHHYQHQQNMVPPPAPPHLQIQVSSPARQRDNPMEISHSNMI